MGQKARLLKWFQDGKKITRLSALTELGIFELSARVIELENAGNVIARKSAKITNRWGESCTVKEYWMEET